MAELPVFLRKHLPASISALKAQRKMTILPRWKTLWATLPRHERIAKIDATLPSQKTYKMLSTLPRREASIIIQLRTGHIQLNVYLKKINAIASALCTKCRVKVRLSPVYQGFLENPEPDCWFGPQVIVNLGPDRWFGPKRSGSG